MKLQLVKEPESLLYFKKQDEIFINNLKNSEAKQEAQTKLFWTEYSGLFDNTSGIDGFFGDLLAFDSKEKDIENRTKYQKLLPEGCFYLVNKINYPENHTIRHSRRNDLLEFHFSILDIVKDVFAHIKINLSSDTATAKDYNRIAIKNLGCYIISAVSNKFIISCDVVCGLDRFTFYFEVEELDYIKE